MPAPITDYTSYAEVRAALGVSAEELQDATLDLAMYSTSLAVELKSVAASVPTDFATIKDKAEDSRTDAEQDVFEAVTMFAPYAVAVQLSTSLPMFAPKSITDGKAGLTRDSAAPFKEAIARCEAEYGRWKAYLASVYAAFNSTSETTTLPQYLRPSSPTSDPVAGT